MQHNICGTLLHCSLQCPMYQRICWIFKPTFRSFRLVFWIFWCFDWFSYMLYRIIKDFIIKKSEWLYPGLFRTVILKPFFILFHALVWYCEGSIYLLVTDISIGVEWPLCLLLKGIFRYICLTNYELLETNHTTRIWVRV